MIIAFWSGNTYTEKEYLENEAGVVLAHIDMIEHVTAAGWCSLARHIPVMRLSTKNALKAGRYSHILTCQPWSVLQRLWKQS